MCRKTAGDKTIAYRVLLTFSSFVSSDFIDEQPTAVDGNSVKIVLFRKMRRINSESWEDVLIYTTQVNIYDTPLVCCIA